MTKRKTSSKKEVTTPKKRRPSGRTPAAEERRMVDLAYRLAEEQLSAGTASSQVISHFLKLGTEKEKLERLILEEEVKLKRAKTQQIESMKRIEELYGEAIKAMQLYSGKQDEEDS